MGQGLPCESCEQGEHSACFGIACACTHITCAPRRSTRMTHQPFAVLDTWTQHKHSEMSDGEER